MEKTTVTTLCFVIENSRILLAMKKRGFGAGWWNGYGGKVQPSEDIEDAAKRETAEEIGIVPQTLDKRAVIKFFIKQENKHIECHVFLITEYSGEPMETEEMRPQWFYFNEIPFDKMWADDRFWYPYLLEGKKFNAEFIMDDLRTLVSHKIEEVR